MKNITKTVSTAGINPSALVYMCSGENFSNEKELVKMNKMLKKNRGGGFTLAELLIVIAIIAILVAIAMPIFSNSLEQAHKAVEDANIRAVKAVAINYILANYDTKGVGYDNDAGTEGRIAHTQWFVTATVNTKTSDIEITDLGAGKTGTDSYKDNGDDATVQVSIKSSDLTKTPGA